VKFVHLVGAEKILTGESGAPGSIVPLADQKDKWIRAEPFAMYEENTLVDPRVDFAHRRMIEASNADHLYMYFPNMNKFKKGKGLTTSFVDDILAVFGPLQSQRDDLQLTGHVTIDGRALDLYEIQTEGSTQELAVDPHTKLTYRYRELSPLPGADPKPVVVASFRFTYDERPPAHVFDWQPPVGATATHNTGRRPTTPKGK
jgi:hypothetical protein